MIPTYPDNCPQYYFADWWIECDKNEFNSGQLLWAYVHHVDQVPMALLAKGRSEATLHNLADCEIVPINNDKIFQRSRLPVASLPCYNNELRTVYRAKLRPVLLLVAPKQEVPPNLVKDKPKNLTRPTALVAPFYGRDEGTARRSGYSQAFLNRVKCCEYPRFVWEQLPIGNSSESILRLDHLMPMSTHYIAYKPTGWKLSVEAYDLIIAWFEWYYTGYLPSSDTSYLPMIREELMKQKD